MSNRITSQMDRIRDRWSEDERQQRETLAKAMQLKLLLIAVRQNESPRCVPHLSA